MKKKLLFLPKYSAKGASSRYRIYSYLPYYKKEGYDFKVSPLLGDKYLNAVYGHLSKWSVILYLISRYTKRIWTIITVSKDTLVYIGAELLPYFPSWFEKYLNFRGVNYIIEFDDAVFHNYDQSSNVLVRKLYTGKFSKIIKNATAVICGCRYLSDYAKQWNENVTLIPTSIDGEKYSQPAKDANTMVVGWIGSPSSSKFVKDVVPAIKKLQETIDFEFRLVGFDKALESELSGLNYRIVDWMAENEVEELRKFTVGIMPLQDTSFARGKCAFKLVQYMAVGVPTVSTPLQSNVDIDRGCGNLFAETTDEWRAALEKFLNDKELREKVGRRNYETAHENYTFQNNFEKYKNVIEDVMNLAN